MNDIPPLPPCLNCGEPHPSIEWMCQQIRVLQLQVMEHSNRNHALRMKNRHLRDQLAKKEPPPAEHGSDQTGGGPDKGDHLQPNDRQNLD